MIDYRNNVIKNIFFCFTTIFRIKILFKRRKNP
jgi:hypothetical protein